MTVTDPILTKLDLPRQPFLRASYSKFEEKPKNGSVDADLSNTTERVEEMDVNIMRSHLYCVKEN
jgi:hypothetical protein